MELIMQIMSYPFMVRAFIVGILVSLCAALLGVSLVLKQYSMIGDGLSHVSYGALSIALACGIAPLKLSIPVVIVSAFFLLRMTENGCLQLYVWQCSGDDKGGCGSQCDLIHSGADPVCIFLS